MCKMYSTNFFTFSDFRLLGWSVLVEILVSSLGTKLSLAWPTPLFTLDDVEMYRSSDLMKSKKAKEHISQKIFHWGRHVSRSFE